MTHNGPTVDQCIYVYSYMDPLWTHSYMCIHIRTHYGPTMDLLMYVCSCIWTHCVPISDPFIYVYLYMDPLLTHYGPIHTSLFLYMDPLWTHSYRCIHRWNHYGHIMDPLWTHSYTCIHIWIHYGPIMDLFMYVCSYIWTPLWTHVGPIHIHVFIYGPSIDPLWTHSYNSLPIYEPIMNPFIYVYS